MDPGARVPPKAWVVTFAGTAVKTRCVPSGENAKSSPLENVVLVG